MARKSSTRLAVRKKHTLVASVEAALLKRVRQHHGLSRVELARELHLAPSTAGIYVDRLIREGYLLEGETADRRLGRRPTLLTPNPSAGRFIGVDLEAQSLMMTAVDFSLQIIQRSRRSIGRGESVERILRRIEEAVDEGRKGNGGTLLGVGVGVPGMIDSARGTASHYTFIPAWRDVPLRARLEARFRVPVELENNIRAMAMAELWLGQGRGLRNFCCFGVRTGIGVGVVVNGELVAGTHGGAGEIGSWPAVAGRNGDAGATLETAASLRAILDAASAAGGRTLDFSALRAAVGASERRVMHVLEAAAAVHGAAIRQLFLLFDPQRIIVVGPLAELGSALLTPLTATAGRRFDGTAPAIVNSTFGEFGGAVGAAALALHRWKPVRG